jgi:hypothetical protein
LRCVQVGNDNSTSQILDLFLNDHEFELFQDY